MSQTIEVKVPDIGDYTDIPVIEVLVKAGDAVELEQSLITLESDKATMDVPSPAAGTVKEVRVKPGDAVSAGTLIVLLEDAGAAGGGDAAAPPKAQQAPDEKQAGRAPQGAAAPARRQDEPAAPAAAPAAAGGGTLEVKVPDIGDYKDVPVIEVLVAVGDRVEAEQSLLTLESDKAAMDVPSPSAGVVKELKVKVGDHVSAGSAIVVLELAGQGAASTGARPAAGAAARKSVEPPADAPYEPVSEPGERSALAEAPAIPAGGEGRGERRLSHASPSVRKFARELGVEIARVAGTGPKNRITQDDVRAYVKGALAGAAPGARPAAGGAPATAGGGLNLLAWPKIDFAKFGPIALQPLSRIKKISGANLHRNWVMIPHVTNNEDADITELEALRVQLNQENEKSKAPGAAKVTMLAFIIKTVVAGLKRHPVFNASLDGDNLVMKQYYHIGFAADTPNGLVVPVIRDADTKGLFVIAQEMAALSKAAREGSLKSDQMQGGSFSISSLGGIGGTYFTPLINAPEVAILGIGRGAMKPVWDGQQFAPRLILPLSLSYDHRVIDGAEAARFNAFLAQVLGDFRRVSL